MLLPRLIYGTWREVKPRIGRVITRLKRGASWPEAVQADDLVDTATSPGLVAIDGPGVYGGPHFHCFGPMRLLWDAIRHHRLPEALQEVLFVASLETAWGVAGLLGNNDTCWVVPVERRLPLVRAAIRSWDVLDTVGPRYSLGSNHGKRLWPLPNNIHYALAHLGVPHEELGRPLPPGGLAELAARHGLLDVQ